MKNKETSKMNMVLPKNCEMITKEEEYSIVGGSCNIPVTKSYLSKSYCLQRADELLKSGQVKGMTKQEVAEELYAHAVVHYGGRMARLITGKSFNSILSHTEDGIDLDDGGDTASRKSTYAKIWKWL